jgi:hypothetical protein
MRILVEESTEIKREGLKFERRKQMTGNEK